MNWQNLRKDYLDYLRLERGLSDNSIANYALDILKLRDWLELNGIADSPLDISEETLQQFVYTIAKEVNPRSQSRIISGLRIFGTETVFQL